jgi:hypothetical protein
VQALVETIPGCAGFTQVGYATPTKWEAVTANLIGINRRYKAHAGIRITDI